MSDSGLYDPNASFEFEYYFQGKMVTCRVVSGESDYGIYFDENFMGAIEINEGPEWEMVGTGLDEDDVQRIGAKIEDHYK